MKTKESYKTDDVWEPQPGPQTAFLESTADIVIYGGAAGGGKTAGILLDATRYINRPKAGAVIFRRTTPQITNEGGLWDTAKEFYLPAGAKPRESPTYSFTFPHPKIPKTDGFKVTFSHLQHEKNVYDWQGSQIAVIYFDELTHFTKKQFTYMMSRNRSTSGVIPNIRASTNPDKTSWVREFIDWWIGPDGHAILERSGKIRWLCRFEEKEYWFNSKEEAIKSFPEIPPVSVTFIPSKLEDNKILMEKDPGYKAKLMAMSKVDRERLLGGNWDIIPVAGSYFKRHYFEEVDAHPALIQTVRCWDRAATEWKPGDPGDAPDWTVGLKLGRDKNNIFYILDVARARLSPHKVERLILNTAIQDGKKVIQKGFQDPGSAGVTEIQNFVRMLAGFPVKFEKIAVDKETAAKPVSSQCEAGNVKILKTCRNKEELYQTLEDFPEGAHDDDVDALSGAFNEIAHKVGKFTNTNSAVNIKKGNNDIDW